MPSTANRPPIFPPNSPKILILLLIISRIPRHEVLEFFFAPLGIGGFALNRLGMDFNAKSQKRQAAGQSKTSRVD